MVCEKKLGKCCFSFGAYTKRFVICDPTLLKLIPGCMNVCTRENSCCDVLATT